MQSKANKIGDDGLTNKEREKLRKYELKIKDIMGKDLKLLLNAIIYELEYRSNHRMLQIELQFDDLIKLIDILKITQDMSSNDDITNTDTNNSTKKPINDDEVTTLIDDVLSSKK